MSCEGIFRDARKAGLQTSDTLIFLFINERSGAHDDLRLVGSRRWLARETGYGEKTVRKALLRLEKVRWISITEGKRKVAVISIVHRQVGPVAGPVAGPVVYDDKHGGVGPVAGPVAGHTGVDVGVDVSHAVNTAVSSSGVEQDLNVKGRAPKGARPPAREGKALDDAALHEPNLRDVTHHIEALYGALSGFKFPWQKGKDFVRLAEKVRAYDAATVLAACDYFFTPANEWATKKGYRIDEFMHQFSELLLKSGIKARAAKYQADLTAQQPPVSTQAFSPKDATERSTATQPPAPKRKAEPEPTPDMPTREEAMEFLAGIKAKLKPKSIVPEPTADAAWMAEEAAKAELVAN